LLLRKGKGKKRGSTLLSLPWCERKDIPPLSGKGAVFYLLSYPREKGDKGDLKKKEVTLDRRREPLLWRKWV